jgi:hypothetical protein
LTNRRKATLGQGVLAPGREDLLNRVDFDSKGQIKGTIRDATSGADQDGTSRGISKELIRDATSEADQRRRSETQRQEEIKGEDQRNRSETQRQKQIKGAD